MRILTIGCCLAVLAGCAKPEQQASSDTTAATMGAGAPAAAISLAAVAGKWNMTTRSATSDSVLLTFELTASGDASGWVYQFPNRPPVTARVVAEGDSIISDMGPYESVLRKGVQVTTHSVMRLQDGKLVGNTTARYTNAGADSVLALRVEGTRAP